MEIVKDLEDNKFCAEEKSQEKSRNRLRFLLVDLFRRGKTRNW